MPQPFECSNAFIHYRLEYTKKQKVSCPTSSFPSIPYPDSNAKEGLLHVGAAVVGLGGHGLALDALGARVVVLRVLADAGGTGIRGDGSLTGTVALCVAGGVVGAEALLLGLLLLELLAGTGSAAVRVLVRALVVVWNSNGCDVRSLGEGRHLLCWLDDLFCDGGRFGCMIIC